MNPKTLSVDHGRELAGDLIRALAPVVGDPEAVNDVMRRWVDVLGARDFGLVCMAAMQTTYTDCLIPTPLDEIPANRLALVTPTTNERKPA